MGVRAKSTGEWCSPTRELGNSQLIQLVDDSRRRDAVETVHDAPTRKCAAAALELLPHARRDSEPVEARSLDDSRALPVAQEVPVPDPGQPMLLSELDVEQATAMLAEVSMMEIAIPPAAVPAQSLAPKAPGVRKGGLGVHVFLCLDVLVFLCLGVLAFLYLAA